MAIQLPESEYFKMPVSIWNHTMNTTEPWNTTLGEFLSGEFFERRNLKIYINDFRWLFKPSAKRPTPIIDPSLYSSIKQIVDDKSVPEIVAALREHTKTHGKDAIADGVKRMLPGATISAQFDKQRGGNFPHTKNRLIAIDIDEVDTNAVMVKLKQLNLCFWISKSVTGTGVYALIPLSSEDLGAHFEAINLLMQEHQITLDPLKDLARLRYWSPPDDVIIEPTVDPFSGTYQVPIDIELYREASQTRNEVLGVTSQYNNHDYALACHQKGLKNVKRNLNLEAGDIGQHLHTYIKYYHWAFNHFGLSLDYAIKWSWENYFKDVPYVIERGHSISKIEQDFGRFYSAYREQHHILDFEQQKRSCLSEINYDLKLTLKQGEKLNALALPLITTVLSGEQDSAVNWSDWNRYILDSPTNSGKTSTFSSYFLSNKVKGLIVVPTQGALEQLTYKYKDAVPYYEKSKEVNEKNILIVTTYASFKKLFNAINIRDRFLVVDEFHNAALSASKDFRNYELNSMLDKILDFKQVVLMTGTSILCHHPNLEGFRKVKVVYEVDTVKNLRIIYYPKKTRWNALLSKVQMYQGLQVIYLDDKQETKGLGRLIQSLKNIGFEESEIQLVNSDQKGEQRYKSLIDNSLVDENIKIIIATKIFVEALNLYNNVTAFHILTPIHGAYMQQLVTRPRKNTYCDVFLYWSADGLNEQDVSFWFDQNQFYRKQIVLAERIVSTFEPIEWDEIGRKSFVGNDVVRRKRAELYSTDNGLKEERQIGYSTVFAIDYLNCDYNTQEMQVVLYKKNPNQLYEYLRQFNWTIKSHEIFQGQNDSLDLEPLRDKDAKFKEHVREFIDHLINEGAYENEDILEQKSYGNVSWQIELRTQYNYLSQLLSNEDANDLIVSIQSNKRAYQQVIEQLKVRQAILFSAPDKKELVNHIFELFPIGGRFSSDEILSKLQSVQENVLRNTVKMKKLETKTAATQILNLFVETKRCKVIDPTGVPKAGRKIAFMNAVEIVSHHPVRRRDGAAIEPILGKADLSRRPKYIRNERRLSEWNKNLRIAPEGKWDGTLPIQE